MPMVSDKNSSVRLIVAIILSALLMVIFNVFFSSKPQVSKKKPGLLKPSGSKEQVASVPVEQNIRVRYRFLKPSLSRSRNDP